MKHSINFKLFHSQLWGVFIVLILPLSNYTPKYVGQVVKRFSAFLGELLKQCNLCIYFLRFIAGQKTWQNESKQKTKTQNAFRHRWKVIEIGVWRQHLTNVAYQAWIWICIWSNAIEWIAKIFYLTHVHKFTGRPTDKRCPNNDFSLEEGRQLTIDKERTEKWKSDRSRKEILSVNVLPDVF